MEEQYQGEINRLGKTLKETQARKMQQQDYNNYNENNNTGGP